MEKPAFNGPQARAFPYALENPYSILALDPRLGKSRVVIEVREKLGGNCLVLCPAYLVLNWVKEIKKWAAPDVQITAIQKGKDIYEICDTDFAVISYDLAKKAENFFDWADMVVIDEGHNLKSMDAQRTSFVHRCVYEYAIPRLHILTGTPIKNRVKEFYSLLALTNYNPRVADSQFLDQYPSEIDFADQFSFRSQYNLEINGRTVPIVSWAGLKNEHELRQHLKGRYLRIRASETDLPPVMNKPVLISETPDEALIAAFNRYFYEDDIPTYEKERHHRTGSVLPEHKAMAAFKKAPFTIKYVEGLLEEVKCCVVYSDHVDAAEAIAQKFNVRALTGKVPANLRSELADKFQAGEGKILVATIGALKEGRDLFRANDIILNDYPWVPGDLTQVINRIRIVGKNTPCMVHEIFGSPQDEYIAEVLKSKIETIDAAT